MHIALRIDHNYGGKIKKDFCEHKNGIHFLPGLGFYSGIFLFVYIHYSALGLR